jgi:hypothetical protein
VGRRLLIAGAATAAASAALIVAPAGAMAAAGAAGGGIVVHERSGADAADSGRWSERRLRRAKPLELPGESARGLSAGSAASAGASDGPPRYGDGRAPLAASAATPDAGARPANFRKFSSNAVEDPEAYPNSANGKLYGRFRGEGAYSCSATVVRGSNRSVIFTAAHCVRDPGRGGRWGTKLTFVPSYSDGEQPFGQWTWDAVYVKRAWSRKGNDNFDYAAITLHENGGQRVEDAVGSLGFAYNLPNRQTYRAVGYPANKRNSEVMWECVSTLGGRDPFHRRPGPAPLGIGCDMTSGASGGGWAIPGNRLASVTSFSYDGLEDQLYGPKLNRKANKLRRRAASSSVSGV